MDHTQAQILMTAAACLMVALFLSIARNACRRKVRNTVRNTVSIDIDCDVAEAREGIRQLTADVERLHGQVKAARKDLAALKADRDVIGLPERKGRIPIPAPWPDPPAAKKKAPNAAPQKKRAAKRA